MLNVIKFDLYKIFRSTVLKVWLFVSILFCTLIPFVTRVANTSNCGILSAIFNEQSYLQFPVLIFALLLGAKDIQSGYIKNIYSKLNKLYYILSKIVCVALYSIYVYAVYWIMHIAFGVIFGGVGFIESVDRNTRFTTNNFLLNVLTNILVLVSVGALGVLLTNLIRNQPIAIIVALLYVFMISGFVYQILDDIFTWGVSGRVQNFFIIGLSSVVNGVCTIQDVLVSLGWLIGSFISSYLIFRNRSV